ncbi:malpha.2 family protein [Megaselia abdita]
MCQQKNIVISKKSTTYTIKNILKTLFKKQQNQQEALFIEFNENMQNEEMDENVINEKLSAYVFEDIHEDEEEEVYVPVRFARTDAGTFFWTTNLSPAVSMTPSSDKDLIQPTFCMSNGQSPQLQFQDRWAQA